MAQFVDYGFAQAVWNDLKSFFGGNEIGTAAMMGNLFAESSIVPYRLQGDFSSGFQTSLQYTDRVDNGTVSEYDFVHNGPNGGGYGLAQWTFQPRKQGLYDMYQTGYSSIGDLSLALAFLHYELNNDYASTKAACTNATSMFDATVYVLKNFENPADSGPAVQQDRTQTAQQIYDRYAGGSPVGEFLVSIINEGEGITTAYPETATAGTTILLTNAPDAGQTFLRYEVLAGAISIGSDGTFTMPPENVTIKAVYTGTTPAPVEYHVMTVEITGSFKGLIVHQDRTGRLLGLYPFYVNGGRKRLYYTGRTGDKFTINFIGARPVIFKANPASEMVGNVVTISTYDVTVTVSDGKKMPIWMYNRRRKRSW